MTRTEPPSTITGSAASASPPLRVSLYV